MNMQEEIQKKAYELYQRSGMRAGRELDNWLEAERIIMARYAEGGRAETPKAKSSVSVQPEKKSPAKQIVTKPEPQKIEAKKQGTKKPGGKKAAPQKPTKSAK